MITRLKTSKPLRNIVASIVALGVTVCAAIQPAKAAVTFSGASGDLSASAAFSIVGGNLQVVLTNTGIVDVTGPASILTAVFFDITGNPTLSSVSAILTAGSSVPIGPTDPGGVVGGEWGYKSGLAGAPGGAKEGISSVGLSLFGGATFPGTNLVVPGSGALDGPQYGITSAGDDPSTYAGRYTPLIQNSVTFELGSLPTGFALGQISNVSFQYGTASTDTHVGGVIPEPETYAMLLAGLGLMGFVARRRRQKNAAI